MKLFTALTAFAIASLSLAQDSARHEIENMLHRWESAIAHKDGKALAAMMEKHGYTIGLDGSRWPFSRAEEDLGGWLKTLSKVDTKVTIDKLDINGDEATVWMTAVTHYTPKGKSAKPGTDVSHHADTLRRINGKWMFVYSQELPAVSDR